MLEMLLKWIVDEVRKRPEVVREWAGKGADWVLEQHSKRLSEKVELETLRGHANEIRELASKTTWTPSMTLELRHVSDSMQAAIGKDSK